MSAKTIYQKGMVLLEMPAYKKKFQHLANYQEKQEQQEKMEQKRYKSSNFEVCEKCGTQKIPEGNCSVCPACGDSECSL